MSGVTVLRTDVHGRYEAVADRAYDGEPVEPISERDRRRKLDKLLEYGLVEETAPNRHGAYVSVDERVTAPVEVLRLAIDEQ